MTIPSAMVTRFFQLVTDKKFTEAERELQRLRQKLEKNEWNEGYFKALTGILLSAKSNNDQYSFMSKINLNDGKILKQYRKEFLKQVDNRLREEYDRGFFSAWADYMRILIRIHKKAQKAEEMNDPPRISKQKKGQITIEAFVKPK
ncbi:hypothetical protein J7K06_03215 [Candidatus Bathyarchaeota archaeon]|nr:hypothetical protein [Candidatus Bathyarchaeota archaeon]